MNKTITIIIIVAVVIVGLVLLTRDGNQSEKATGEGDVGVEESSDTTDANSSEAEKFNKVPQFTLSDYEGNQVSVNDFPGKILVINSWAAWCPFCVDELPAFRDLQERFPNEIVVIAIDRQESLSTAQGYTDNAGISDAYTFLLDPNDSFYRSIGGFSMPETLFVDTEGNIRIHKRGPMKLKEMVEKVESILNS